MRFRSLRYLVPLIATAGFLAPWGCSASTNDNTFTTSTTTTSVGQGAGGAGGAGDGGSGNSGQGGFNIGGNGQGGSGVDPDAACAATSTTAERVPLDIIVLLDQSGSMSGTRWDGSVAALTSFINDPSSAGINMGLQYFPHSSSDECVALNYATLDVDLGELPMHAPTLVSSLDAHDPNGPNTPMQPALHGVLARATAYQELNPTHKVIVVFATDGSPSGCTGNTVAATAQSAASALNYNGVQTYVIAIQGATVASLNQIAQAGGTGQAIDVTNDITAFQAAMEQIRNDSLACEFPLPPAPDGQQLDLGKVAVKFTDGMGQEIEIPRAEDAADCGSGPGWHYNKPIFAQPPPDKIILCPASCATVQGTIQANISVYFGCEPDVN